MIDRNRRDKLALHLRQYVTGRIWNETFENRLVDDVSDGWLPEQYYRSRKFDPDPLIPPMLEHVWFLYSDCSFHRARGKYSITGDNRKVIARYVLFLHSDLEYSWPSFRFVNPIIDLEIPFLKYLKKFFSKRLDHPTCMEFDVHDWDDFIKYGDFDYWPFINKEEFESELGNTRYLTGRKSI